MRHIRLVVASAVVIAGLVVPAAVGSAAFLSSPVAGSSGGGLSLKLSASTETPVATKPVTLTATSSVNVRSTGLSLVIYDLTHNVVVASCSKGNVCKATVNESTNFQQYVAEFARPNGHDVQASSASIEIVWLVPRVYGLDAISPGRAGQPVPITAVATASVSGTPFQIRIFDAATGETIAECRTGSTCSVTVTGTGTHTYNSEVTDRNGVNAQGLFPVSTTISWPVATVTLAAGAASVPSGRSDTLTATSSVNVGAANDTIRIVDTTTNSRTIASCGSGTVCRVDVSSGPGTRSYIAEITSGSGRATAIVTQSAPVTVTWTSPPPPAHRHR